MVTVMKGGEEVKISKRAGSYVTVRDLIDEVGRDAVRYFFLMRKGDSQLEFDVDLARSQSEENPVYYIQMAHARMSGIFRVGEIDPASVTGEGVDFAQLAAPEERELIKALLDFPALVAGAAAALEPHRVATYLLDTAGKVHLWYHTEHVLDEPDADHARRGSRPGARRRRSCCTNGLTAARHLRAGAHVTAAPCSCVGSVALDSVETPFGKADNVIGGSANFFAASASHLAAVRVVGVVGNDYPIDKLEPLIRARRRPRRPRAGRRRVVPLARPLPARPQRRRNARDAPRRVLQLPPEDSRAVPRRRRSSSSATSIRGCSSTCSTRCASPSSWPATR